MMVDTFTQNVQQLAADPALRQDAGEAAEQIRAGEAENFDKIALTEAMAAGPRNVDDAVSSVVLIRAGGDEGSRVLISKDGYIITLAAHVVEDAPQVKVRWSDGEDPDADVVRAIKERDVALLKTDPHGRTPLALRTATSPRSATRCSPSAAEYGEKFQSSVTKGVMSADRVVDGFAYIQSDVTTAPGSSGGPLLDSEAGLSA